MEYGYAGEILKVDLSTRNISRLITAEYANRFLGGRGIGAKIYWDLTAPETRAFDPENCFICITGPVAGFTRLAGCRWQICGKSRRWGQSISPLLIWEAARAWLKYAGYDGIVATGTAAQPVLYFS
jgi:aldehyde:ferredoxin oxidoreductase